MFVVKYRLDTSVRVLNPTPSTGSTSKTKDPQSRLPGKDVPGRKMDIEELTSEVLPSRSKTNKLGVRDRSMSQLRVSHYRVTY